MALLARSLTARAPSLRQAMPPGFSFEPPATMVVVFTILTPFCASSSTTPLVNATNMLVAESRETASAAGVNGRALLKSKLYE